MNTGNETAPVHIFAFICTLTLLIRASSLSFLLLLFFFTVKKRRRKRVRVVRTLDLKFGGAELKSRSDR